MEDGTGKTERKASGRIAAIACFGLAAASVGARATVQSSWPDLALLPIAGAGLFASAGFTLLVRSMVVGRKETDPEPVEATVQISSYSPEMVDGSDGAEAVRAVLAPVAEAEADDSAHLAEAAARVASGRALSPDRVSARRLGAEWAHNLRLSRREQARLEADPFVQRLARLG